VSTDEGRTFGQQDEEKDDVEAHNLRHGKEEPETEGDEDVEAHSARVSSPRES